jgi:glutathione S-transferase
LSRFNNPAKYCEVPEAAESVRETARRMALYNFGIANERLGGRDLFFDALSVVDAYFFWCVRRAVEFAFPLSDLPNCVAHFERMRSRPSVQKVTEFERKVKEQFARG